MWRNTINKLDREKGYRIYVTDMLRGFIYTQSTKDPNIPRYINIIEPAKPEMKEPEQTAEEVIFRISEKLDRLGGK